MSVGYTIRSCAVFQRIMNTSPKSLSLLSAPLIILNISWTRLYMSMTSKICPPAQILTWLKQTPKGHQQDEVCNYALDLCEISHTCYEMLNGLASRAQVWLSWLDLSLLLNCQYCYLVDDKVQLRLLVILDVVLASLNKSPSISVSSNECVLASTSDLL